MIIVLFVVLESAFVAISFGSGIDAFALFLALLELAFVFVFVWILEGSLPTEFSVQEVSIVPHAFVPVSKCHKLPFPIIFPIFHLAGIRVIMGFYCALTIELVVFEVPFI